MLENIWWNTVAKSRKNLWDYLVLIFLMFISLFYRAGLGIKKLLYRTGILKGETVPVKIIGIGNITVGGTGKTPFTEEFAKRLSRAGRNVLVAAKGYGRKPLNRVDIVSEGQGPVLKPLNSGDEPFLLARGVKDAKVVVGSKKLEAIKYGISRFSPDIILLDDAFQKRELLQNSQHVVLIDALNPFGFGRLFPAGMLREPVKAIKEASAVVITNTNLLDSQERLAVIKERIFKADKNAKIFEAEHQPKYFYNIFTGDKHSPGFIRGKKIIVFSSLGNPVGFERTLKQMGAHVVVSLRFRDHHKFRKKEFEAISKLYSKTQAAFIVTTEKDEIRINRKHLEEKKVIVLKIGMLIKNIKELERRLRIS